MRMNSNVNFVVCTYSYSYSKSKIYVTFEHHVEMEIEQIGIFFLKFYFDNQ